CTCTGSGTGTRAHTRNDDDNHHDTGADVQHLDAHRRHRSTCGRRRRHLVVVLEPAKEEAASGDESAPNAALACSRDGRAGRTCSSKLSHVVSTECNGSSSHAALRPGAWWQAFV